MTDATMFNRLFIDYMESLFFQNPEVGYDEVLIINRMPDFYNNPHMVSCALQILLMEDKISHEVMVGRDIYRAKMETFEKIKAQKIREETTKTMDLKVKELTANNFYTARNISLASLLISICAVIITFLNYRITYLKDKEQQLLPKQTELHKSPHTLLPRTDSANLHETTETKVSSDKK